MQDTIYTSLKKDHDEALDLLDKLVKDPGNSKLFSEFKNKISAHDKAEEKTFYPALKKKLEKIGDVVEFSHEEHHNLDKLVKLYTKIIGKETDERDVLIKVIRSSLSGHINKEENEIFNLAKKYLTAEESKEIDVEFRKKKDALKKK